MGTHNKKKVSSDDMWIISDGRSINLNFYGINEETWANFGVEYRISDIARYLLNPNPIEIEKKLIGCEVHYHQPSSNKIKEKIRRIIPKRTHSIIKDNNIAPDILESKFERKSSLLKDENLKSHINRIYDSLMPYDSMVKELTKLDNIHRIKDITGVCEDIDGNRSTLTLHGNVNQKIDYIINMVSKDVKIIIEKAYLSNGLFEMRGFDFESYDSTQAYRFIKFTKNGKAYYCVLNADNTILYWVDDTLLIHYIHLLEQSLRTNARFNDSLRLCAEGKAKPVKLFFYTQLKINYSQTKLPEIYRKVLENCSMGSNERDLVINSLQNMQLGILFNY
ncbi:MAG: hypothetical protein SVW57_01580, partial [Thermodesulfobacteriota bacterium]|nr:hypothetical protein [Thermodesulfobacteriota bacterium]